MMYGYKNYKDIYFYHWLLSITKAIYKQKQSEKRTAHKSSIFGV